MANPLIRTLNGWRFERPLALVLGAAAAFATIAMPHALFGRLPGVTASGVERPLQVVVALLVAVVAAAVAYAAMKRPTARWAAEAPHEEEDDTPAIDIPVRLRRADAHPDFPPREPIRASRDLGMPFMKIRSTPTQATPRPVPPADVVELTDVAPGAEDAAPTGAEEAPAAPGAIQPAEPIAPIAPNAPNAPIADDANPPAEAARALDDVTIVPTAWPLGDEAEETHQTAPKTGEDAAHGAELDAPAAMDGRAAPAGDSPDRPASAEEAPRRETLAEMMARLSAGIEARAGKPIAPPPAELLADVLARPAGHAPDMREALDELNRLAGRRR